MKRLRVGVHADFHQFYLMDAVLCPDIPEQITEADMAARLRTAPGIVVFHAYSAESVLVELVVQSCPATDVGSWSHTALFSLEVGSGELALCGCTEHVATAPRIEVSSGSYKGLALYGDPANPEGERYTVILWPA
jgi:hypothetical protein